MLTTERLILRRLELADAPAITALVNDKAIAATTYRIPYPYTEEIAVGWIRGQNYRFDQNEEITFAIVLQSSQQLIGITSLNHIPAFRQAVLGYWIGKAHWNQGYATEAARAMLQFGFEQMQLARIYAETFADNQASDRVLLKIGMQHEGTLRQHIEKWNKRYDVKVYGVLADEFS